jgi:hypothetical protein
MYNISYTLLSFSYYMRPEIVRMSYLTLTEKKLDGEGKQRTQGYSIIFHFNFGGAKLDTYL